MWINLKDFLESKPTHDNIVMVQWADSVQPSHEWEWLDDVARRETIVARSVGFYIYHNSTVLAIAGTKAGGADGHRQQVIGITRIPLVAISNIWVIPNDFTPHQ